jgi:hypothetical protein
MDLFGSFGYAPPLLSWPSSRPWTLLPSQIWGLFWLPTLSNDWRNGGCWGDSESSLRTPKK